MLVLTGPSGSGKTHRILAEFRDAVKARRSDIRLVVPTATLVQHLRHELAREGPDLQPARSILTLSAFLSELCGELDLADDVTLTLAAAAAVREVSAPEFARVSRLPGFHAAVVPTISELDAAGCVPEQFARVRLDEPLARPLLEVWRSIERQLAARKLYTRSQILRRAASGIATRIESPEEDLVRWVRRVCTPGTRASRSAGGQGRRYGCAAVFCYRHPGARGPARRRLRIRRVDDAQRSGRNDAARSCLVPGGERGTRSRRTCPPHSAVSRKRTRLSRHRSGAAHARGDCAPSRNHFRTLWHSRALLFRRRIGRSSDTGFRDAPRSKRCSPDGTSKRR